LTASGRCGRGPSEDLLEPWRGRAARRALHLRRSSLSSSFQSLGGYPKRSDEQKRVTRERNGKQRRRARPHDESKTLAIVRTMAIRTIGRSWTIDRDDTRKFATCEFAKIAKSDPTTAALARGSPRSAAPSVPARPTLPPCSPPSRPSPAGAFGSLDRGCARRRRSSKGRDGRMAPGRTEG